MVRVSFELNDKLNMQGTLRPAGKALDNAVLLSGTSERQFLYTIGLHRSGMAVLSIQAPVDLPPASRPGQSQGHQTTLFHWPDS